MLPEACPAVAGKPGDSVNLPKFADCEKAGAALKATAKATQNLLCNHRIAKTLLKRLESKLLSPVEYGMQTRLPSIVLSDLGQLRGDRRDSKISALREGQAFLS